MGLLDKIRGEFIDIIEWTDLTGDSMVYRFDRRDNEIKMGAKLTVREGQVAVAAAVLARGSMLAESFASSVVRLIATRTAFAYASVARRSRSRVTRWFFVTIATG